MLSINSKMNWRHVQWLVGLIDNWCFILIYLNMHSPTLLMKENLPDRNGVKFLWQKSTTFSAMGWKVFDIFRCSLVLITLVLPCSCNTAAKGCFKNGIKRIPWDTWCHDGKFMDSLEHVWWHKRNLRGITQNGKFTLPS